MNVLFVYVANSGRSVMAERIFRQLAGDHHHARSAGSPGSVPHPQVVEALQEMRAKIMYWAMRACTSSTQRAGFASSSARTNASSRSSSRR